MKFHFKSDSTTCLKRHCIFMSSESKFNFEIYIYTIFDIIHMFSIDVRWSDLLNQLNGVFCSSILNMDPALTVTPKMLMHNPDLLWRYGALSSETVCSENLKPWKKLLPCKQVCILASL